MYGLVCFCPFEQKARADGFPKPHEKEVVLDKSEFRTSPNHSRNMAWDLGMGGFFAHLVFELESFYIAQAGPGFMILKRRIIGMYNTPSYF